MPVTPYAKVQVSVAGGAQQQGGITVLAAQSIQPSLVSTVDVTSCRWELYAFPPGYTVPSGWSTATDGTFYYVGVTPTPFTTSATWGKYLIRATVNGGILPATQQSRSASELIDNTTAVQVKHTSGRADIALKEEGQFGGANGWGSDLRDGYRYMVDNAVLTSALAYNGTTGFSILPSANVTTPANVVIRASDAQGGTTGSGTLTLAAGKFISGSGTPGSVVLRSANDQKRFEVNNSGVGFNGANPVSIPTLPNNATDLATAITLVNAIKAQIITYGLSNLGMPLASWCLYLAYSHADDTRSSSPYQRSRWRARLEPSRCRGAPPAGL